MYSSRICFVNETPALDVNSCKIKDTEIIRSYSTFAATGIGMGRITLSWFYVLYNVMRLRNFAILFMAFILTFGVARMLLTVSRAEDIGNTTARADTAKMITADAATATKHDGDVDHILLATSTHFESLMLMLLGTVLLTVALGIKMAQSRRVR
jgi:hypothetical protein